MGISALLSLILGLVISKRPPVITNMPRAIVLILDGNRRWAKLRGLLGMLGHDEGLQRCRELIPKAFELGIEHVVLWAASFSNLTDRDEAEVRHLVSLLKGELRQRISDPDKDECRFRLVGSWRKTKWADEELCRLADEAERLTAKWNKRNLTVLFGYDFRMDMVETIDRLMVSCPNYHQLSEREREAEINRQLSTGYLGDIDLIVRTGTEGDPHWSASFLGWNVANAQLTFLKIPWPAFGISQLYQVLRDYSTRPRRKGA